MFYFFFYFFLYVTHGEGEYIHVDNKLNVNLVAAPQVAFISSQMTQPETNLTVLNIFCSFSIMFVRKRYNSVIRLLYYIYMQQNQDQNQYFFLFSEPLVFSHLVQQIITIIVNRCLITLLIIICVNSEGKLRQKTSSPERQFSIMCECSPSTDIKPPQ